MALFVPQLIENGIDFGCRDGLVFTGESYIDFLHFRQSVPKYRVTLHFGIGRMLPALRSWFLFGVPRVRRSERDRRTGLSRTKGTNSLHEAQSTNLRRMGNVRGNVWGSALLKLWLLHVLGCSALANGDPHREVALCSA